MRIRRYPGKAVDASLSLEQSNAMETIYKNNWLNAHETIKSHNVELPVQNGSYTYSLANGTDEDNVYQNGVSSLGKYQMTLEQIRQLEMKNKDPSVTQAIKDLSGYKPSTLRRKNRKHYPGWDDFIDADQKQSNQLETTANNTKLTVFNESEWSEPVKKQQPAPIRPGILKNGDSRNYQSRQREPSDVIPFYVNNANVVKRQSPSATKLKRSQTLKESTGPSFCSTLDFKDMFRRRSKGKLIENCDNSILLNNKNGSCENTSEGSRSNSSSPSSSKSSTELLPIINDCDIKNGRNAYFQRKEKPAVGRRGMNNELITSVHQQTVHDQYIMDPKIYHENGQNSRMHNNYSNSTNSINIINNNNLPTTKPIKPVQRAKSVRIQHQNMTLQQFDDSPIKKPPTPPIRDSSVRQQQTLSTSPPQSNANTISKKFNTISIAGTKIRPTIQAVTTLPVTPSPNKSILKQVIIESPRQTAINTNGHGITVATVETRRKPASSSSTDSDEMFSIPRPRLIVPVHTYARKRRTGNLINAKAADDDDDADDVDANINDKGMCFFLLLCLVIFI